MAKGNLNDLNLLKLVIIFKFRKKQADRRLGFYYNFDKMQNKLNCIKVYNTNTLPDHHIHVYSSLIDRRVQLFPNLLQKENCALTYLLKV